MSNMEQRHLLSVTFYKAFLGITTALLVLFSSIKKPVGVLVPSAERRRQLLLQVYFCKGPNLLSCFVQVWKKGKSLQEAIKETQMERSLHSSCKSQHLFWGFSQILLWIELLWRENWEALLLINGNSAVCASCENTLISFFRQKQTGAFFTWLNCSLDGVIPSGREVMVSNCW